VGHLEEREEKGGGGVEGALWRPGPGGGCEKDTAKKEAFWSSREGEKCNKCKKICKTMKMKNGGGEVKLIVKQ